MEEFINALIDFNYYEILPILDRISEHLEKGYLTFEDKFFIDFCLPLIDCTNENIKSILKGDNDE